MDLETIIKLYKEGESINSIAKQCDTHATTIRRLLIKHNVELRHDTRKKGEIYTKKGAELLAWAKAQGRLVTKAELAHVVGRARLSDSYFIQYPELSKYVKDFGQKSLSGARHKLYNWLDEVSIPYKPNDKKAIHASVTALLLGDYTGLAIQLLDKPYNVSVKNHNNLIESKREKAKEYGIGLVFISSDAFDYKDRCDNLYSVLNEMRK